MLDPSICILCGGCVDVCPEKCIRIVPIDDIEGVQAEAPASALIIQEERCIRCALCVDRCPTDALSLDGWSEASSAPIALAPVGS
jgi:formate hydrogenlyase subunit 6/NADH:ubiquinone oxidoreductase subunit I